MIKGLPINCIQCGLFQYSQHYKIQGRGNKINPKVVLIGEAPGPEEVIQGIPFVGRAGKKLNSMIKEYGDIFYITNMVKCFPPISTINPTKGFRTPKDTEINLCKSFLVKEILEISHTINPILMSLGNIALKGLIGEHKGITKELGNKHTVCLETSDNTFRLIPNYHPSYILRNPSMESEFKKVLRLINEFNY